MSALTVSNLKVDIFDMTVLHDIDLTLDAGEVLGVVGESGSGKSMTALSVMQLLPRGSRWSGEIRVGGVSLADKDERALCQMRGRDVGMIFQEPMTALNPVRTIGDQVAETVRVHTGLSRREALAVARQMLNRVGLPEDRFPLDRYPHDLSGGQRQRVVIAQAIALRPKVLIADEPTTALDVTTQAQILDLLKELVREDGMGLMLITHDLAVVAELADTIAILKDGAVVEAGPTRQVFRQMRHPYTRALFSASAHVPERDRKPEPAVTPVLSVRDVVRDYQQPRRNLFVRRPPFRAVDHVGFDIRHGENVGLVGESGCGKSTLTRLLAWLEKPEQGTIRFGGKDLAQLTSKQLTDLRQSFQLLLQDPYSSLPSRMPVGRIIAEGLLIHRSCKRSEVRERVLAAMREVGLDPALENHLTVGLSAGQRQRINIARALVLQPRLMILDETLSALDQVEQSKLFELFERLQKKHGFTYIFISHDMALVRKVCHRVAVMYLGRIVELADNKTLFESPTHPYSRALLSAVPTLDAHPFKAQDYLLEGEPPSPVHIPAGCVYRSRCPLAFAKCQSVDPMPVAIPNGGYVACHLASEATAPSIETIASANQD
ncbi:MAG: ABC transporter ATP-binding protein [Pseudorhodobacter sp.]|nr:ABC transporter ATP-binding protein [Pseudorhodobacter sp.]